MATASFLPPVSNGEEETDGGTSSQFYSKNQQQQSSSNTTNNVTNINDINPDALLKTIQGLMNSVSEMRSEVESLRNHVAEALGIMWRRSTNSETKTTRRFKVFRNKIKTMETAIRILQDRMNSSFMGGPQFNENYHNSIHRRNQNDDVDSPSSYFFSPSSHHSNGRGANYFSNGSADARRYQEIMQHYENNSSNNNSTRLSRNEAERRRAALQAARRKKNKKKNHESDNDDENDSNTNNSSSRAPSGSPPPPSSSKSPNTSLSPTSSPRHHLHRNAQTPSKSPTKTISPSSSPKLSAPTFIPILGSDVSLVSANNNKSVSESKKQNSDDIFGGNTNNSKNNLAAVGVIVVRVPLGSPLHSSGVQVGDRIVQVDGRNLNSSEEVVKLWQMSKKNIISQKNNSITISVVPGRTAQKIQMEHDNSSSLSSLFSEFVKQSIQVALKLYGVKNGNDDDDDDDDDHNNNSSDMIPSPNSYHKNHHSSSSPHPLVVNQAFNGARANGSHAGTLDASGTKRNQSPQPTTPRWH